MVAGEDPEAAGVDREALVDPVLGAEVGDRTLPLELLPHVGDEARRRRLVEVVIERLEDPRQAVDVARAERGVRHPVRAQVAEERDRVPADDPPEVGVELGEEPAGVVVPGPVHVVGEPVEEDDDARSVGIALGSVHGGGDFTTRARLTTAVTARTVSGSSAGSKGQARSEGSKRSSSFQGGTQSRSGPSKAWLAPRS